MTDDTQVDITQMSVPDYRDRVHAAIKTWEAHIRSRPTFHEDMYDFGKVQGLLDAMLLMVHPDFVDEWIAMDLIIQPPRLHATTGPDED